MSLGLKRGTVALEPHDDAWDAAARQTIRALRDILGQDALDIQHVGSTAIRGTVAKPIVDIAVCVRRLDDARRHDAALAAQGIIFRKREFGEQLLYVIGEGEVRTHHIHVLCSGDPAWRNYNLFRDYLNAAPEAEARYTALKRALGAACAGNREAYTQGKAPLIRQLLEEAHAWDAAGHLK